MTRRAFLRLAGGGGGAVAAASLASAGLSACASHPPERAVEAWRGPESGLAAVDVRRWLLSYAILAPHAHNLQSWVADLRVPGEISLYCDRTRLLPHTDPHSRQIMLSHGTFLELLDLAARERGLRATMDLFPQGVFAGDTPDERPVARVRLSPDATRKPDPLFAQILHRRTHRGRYDAQRTVAATAWQVLTDAARVEAAPTPMRTGHVGVDQPADHTELGRIALQAWRTELTTARTILESYRLLRVGAAEVEQYRDGLSLLDPLVVALKTLGLFDRSRAPSPDDYATTSQMREFEDKLASTPGFLWLATHGNDRVTQIHAGRAYARVQLAATALGLSMQPLSQALQEYPEQAQSYADIHALTGAQARGETVQMWVRVGYADAAAPSPRRPLAAFIRS